jgi:hypothetical protein
LESVELRRYFKITLITGAQQIAYAFIEKTTGDVLKPATDWMKPARTVRGNLFSQHGGMEAVSPDGMNIRSLV